MRLDQKAQEAFHEAMTRGGYAALDPAPSKPIPPSLRNLMREGDLYVGDAEIGGPVGLALSRLIEGRCLIQGASGAGKSWTLRRLLEQSAGLMQQIVVDPEGEFESLAQAFGLTHVEAHHFDIAAIAEIARNAREHRLSVVLDLSEQDRTEQMKTVAAFFNALIDAPREHWHAALVAVDEAHLFAPFGGAASEAGSVRKAAIGAVVDLMSRGRKRGLAGVLATQRMARLAKSVISEVHNFLIGLNTLDLDIRRAAETIGWDARKAFDRLPMLEPGDFVAVGPAFSRSPAIIRVGAIETKHTGAAPALVAPEPLKPEDAAELLCLGALAEASQASADILSGAPLPQPGLRAVRDFIRDPAFPDAGRIVGALRRVAPDGARVGDLAKTLNRTPGAIASGLALLDQWGVVDFMGAGDSRAVRIVRGMT